MAEVFPAFCRFVEGLKRKWPDFGAATGGSARGRDLYFASVDIQHCYDTINQKRLFQLVRNVAKEDVYLTKHDSVMTLRDDDDALRCRWRKSTCPPAQFSQILTTHR